MFRNSPYRGKVLAALQALSAREHMIGPLVVWFEVHTVATEAGVAVATARRHLDDLSHCRGVRTRRVQRTLAYRYDELPHHRMNR